MKTEKWKPVVGYEGTYEISDRGRIRSLERTLCDGRRMKGKALKPWIHSEGYSYIYLCRDGKPKGKFIHRLILEAFTGPCPDGMECCHNNGDPLDNRLKNLRWDTRSNNEKDKVLHGTDNRGENNWNARLCELDIWLIRNCDGTQRQLAEFFGVSQVLVGLIKLRRRWAHVE